MSHSCRAPAPDTAGVIRVLSPEDFVLFKLLSIRDRDLEDAASVLRAPDLSLAR